MIKPAVPALLGIAMLSTGCPLATIEAELDEACVTRTGIEVTPPADVGAATVTQGYMVDDLAGLRDLVDLDAELHFVRFEARVTAGLADLDFVDAAHVSISSGNPDSTLPTLIVYDCAGDCPVTGVTLGIPATGHDDAAAYIASDSLIVDVEFAGVLPAQAFTMDVDVCVGGTINYSLEP